AETRRCRSDWIPARPRRGPGTPGAGRAVRCHPSSCTRTRSCPLANARRRRRGVSRRPERPCGNLRNPITGCPPRKYLRRCSVRGARRNCRKYGDEPPQSRGWCRCEFGPEVAAPARWRRAGEGAGLYAPRPGLVSACINAMSAPWNCQQKTLTVRSSSGERLRSALTVTPGYTHWWTLWRALKRHSKRFLLTMNVMGPTISCMRLHAAVTNASRVSAFPYLLQETSRRHLRDWH